uniref:HMG box domain-containing protein n=1 Tax=Panagrolaimus sp. PS1159 TaxID=55785 RepID=A0AC35GL70_9BILA
MQLLPFSQNVYLLLNQSTAYSFCSFKMARSVKAIAAKKAKAALSGKVTKPKPPQNAYNLWYRENRDTIIKEKRLKNLGKAARAAWKKLEDKSKWEEMAKEDKERYQREMNEHSGNNGQSASAGEDQ